jgi:hypothetical protein
MTAALVSATMRGRSVVGCILSWICGWNLGEDVLLFRHERLYRSGQRGVECAEMRGLYRRDRQAGKHSV